MTDGPFVESKEVIGGWAILKADSMAEALRVATEFMELHRRHWPEFEGDSEVRPRSSRAWDREAQGRGGRWRKG